MNYFKIKILAILTLLMSSTMAQTINVIADPDIQEWDLVYLTNFDFENGQNNPLIFGYRLSAPAGTRITIEFALFATVPSMNLNNEELFRASVTFTIQGDIYITNRDLDRHLSERGIRDVLGNQIHFDDYTWDAITKRDPDLASSLQASVLSSGSLPAGEYRYVLNVSGGDVNYNFPNERTFIISNPSAIDLVFPTDGYQFAGNTYPVFEWSSTGCEHYAIRICEYNPTVHSSYEDAIQSEAVFPYPDNGGFVEIGSSIQLDYSTANGRPLEPGKSYVWQVKKTCYTNIGNQDIYSEIYSFTITEVGAPESECLQQIHNALGDNQYNALFGPNGPLHGLTDCPEITLDGQPISATDFANLLMQLMSGAYTIESITTQ